MPSNKATRPSPNPKGRVPAFHLVRPLFLLQGPLTLYKCALASRAARPLRGRMKKRGAASPQRRRHYRRANAQPKTVDAYQCVPWRRIDATMHTKPVARGFAVTTLEQSSTTVNAQLAHVDIDADSLAKWNDPMGTRESVFTRLFCIDDNQRNDTEAKVLQFYFWHWWVEQHAYEYGYCLCHLPLRHSSCHPMYSWPLKDPLLRENNGPLLQPSSSEELEAVTAGDNRANSNINCKAVREYLKRVGYHPELSAAHVSCLLTKACIPAWGASMTEPKLIHFRASEKEY
jgi:hypothetical protein